MNHFDSIESFIKKQSAVLESAISAYLAGRMAETEVQHIIKKIFDEWESSTLGASPELPFETPFWCALWAAQHLCSPSHIDQSTQKELAFFASVLRGENPLPSTYVGHRP